MGRTIKLLLLFFAYQLAVTGAFTGFYMLWNGSMDMPDPTADSYVTFLLVIQVTFTVLLSAHLYFGKYVKWNKDRFKIYNRPIMWMLSLILIVGMGLWNNYLNELADLPNTMENLFQEMMTHPLGIFATVVMAPVMEELLFRGAIQGHLMRIWKNPTWAILLSSLLFGLVHGNPAQIPFAFIVGLGLGWMYYVTGSLAPCFFMHFVNNGSAVVIFWLTENPDATFIEMYGIKIATGLAIIGVILTIVGILGVKKNMKNSTPTWFGLPD